MRNERGKMNERKNERKTKDFKRENKKGRRERKKVSATPVRKKE
jgi:hypothetical protein